MDKAEAQNLMTESLAPHRAQSYAELASQVGAVSAFQTKGPSGTEYNVEIMIVWNTPGVKANIRVTAFVDDGRWPSWFFSKGGGFIMAPDGSFVGE